MPPIGPIKKDETKAPVVNPLGRPKKTSGPECAACNDTRKNSKGGTCLPCLLKGRIKK